MMAAASPAWRRPAQRFADRYLMAQRAASGGDDHPGLRQMLAPARHSARPAPPDRLRPQPPKNDSTRVESASGTTCTPSAGQSAGQAPRAERCEGSPSVGPRSGPVASPSQRQSSTQTKPCRCYQPNPQPVRSPLLGVGSARGSPCAGAALARAKPARRISLPLAQQGLGHRRAPDSVRASMGSRAATAAGIAGSQRANVGQGLKQHLGQDGSDVLTNERRCAGQALKPDNPPKDIRSGR